MIIDFVNLTQAELVAKGMARDAGAEFGVLIAGGRRFYLVVDDGKDPAAYGSLDDCLAELDVTLALRPLPR